ncbi:MAG: 1-deoxy-D-xylulose-5-phosphate synthase [Coriobacteriales bacterium]|jgi:1-deoxy-D-xylulose-5-phosphate synthase|nr:1-deoxy-D-xylulose-5-phosphate synthase [Coriobacteriales bacterium]
MSLDLLQSIERPDDLRALSPDELLVLAAQLRERMVAVTSDTGGHLASSLGAVETIIALHRVFDFSFDRLVFDVGHQSYAHKLLTGRNTSFETLRQKGGIGGFPKREESLYDVHDSGHASDSLSIACGLAVARDLNGGFEEIVALIGDASLSGGMAFEALNQIGHDHRNLCIVLNDNEMSISRNVGALSLYLGKARMSRSYTLARDTVEEGLGRTGRVGRALVNAGEAAKGSVKKLVVPGMFFEDMDIKYFGPIDGHNIGSLEEALRAARQFDGPVLIHAVTQKGRGYAPAEARPELYHGIGRFDPRTGAPTNGAGATPSYTEVLGAALVAEADQNEDIIALTAGMTRGTGLQEFKQRYPERFLDVGIAEEHAVAQAAGLALGGKKPVVAIYSTFLQRAYDQIAMDVALQKLPVVFCVDRAGLVGEDGATHQGAFDLVYLRSIPNMRIIAPYTARDLRLALHTALSVSDGPVAIRYPRGATPVEAEPCTTRGDATAGEDCSTQVKDAAAAAVSPDADTSASAERSVAGIHTSLLPIGRANRLRSGKDLALLALGSLVPVALECAELLCEQGLEATVYDMLWVKPLDSEAVRKACSTGLVATLENGSLEGGFGSAVLEELARQQRFPRVLTFGLPDAFIEHGSQETLLQDLGLTAPDIATRIAQTLEKR